MGLNIEDKEKHAVGNMDKILLCNAMILIVLCLCSVGIQDVFWEIS